MDVPRDHPRWTGTEHLKRSDASGRERLRPARLQSKSREQEAVFRSQLDVLFERRNLIWWTAFCRKLSMVPHTIQIQK